MVLINLPETYFSNVIRREGGFVNHPNDPGGATKYGVSLKYARSYGDRDKDGFADLDIDRDGDVDDDDIRLLTLDQVRLVYDSDYFTGPRINQLVVDVQEQLFDMAVHHGPRQAIKFLQKVLNLAGFGMLKEDGILGSKTIPVVADAQRQMGPYLSNALAEERLAFMWRLVERDPGRRVFMVKKNGGKGGWVVRAEEFIRPTGDWKVAA